MNGSDQLIEALFDGCAFTIAITEASRMEVLAQKYKLHELDLKKLAAIDPTSILTPEEVSQMAEGLIERIIGYSDLYKTGQNPSLEHVVAAAWQSPGENIYAGDSHHDAFKEAVADGNAEAIQASKMPVWREAIQSMGWRDGFVTNTDRWITRQEALALGRKQKQFTVQPLKGSVAVGAASEYFR